ncbi:MAG: UDP-N-acetylglucosamine--N-acetylmuramyl-(pentapeptide) pyrophosphoryl-undecaprenol N-acetylglucosamine transferase [Planctomycetota bacterium]
MRRQPHILIAGGGSLGCVFPGLTIARRLLERVPGAQITLVGDGRAIERHTVHAAGLRYACVPRSERPAHALEAPGYVLRNAAGWCVAHWLLHEQETDLVVSLGGHAAGPMVRAARSSGVPYVLVEQNAELTPATRELAPDAASVCLAFDETAPRLPLGSPAVVTGGVGRPGFEDTFAVRHRASSPSIDDGRPRLVVLGGVAGSSSLNETLPTAIARLGEAADGWQIVHQTGAGWLTATEQRYRDAGVEAIVVSYIDELAHLTRASDLVVCRPGGSALAELAMAGLPAVLVPDRRRGNGPHEANARMARLAWGCPVVDERSMRFPADLAEALSPLMREPSARQQIAQRVASGATPTASATIAEACCVAIGLAQPQPVRLAA